LSQIPALLISIASALIVTRAISDGTFGSDITTQFSGNSRVFWIAAVFLVVLGFIPGAGFPTYLLLPMGVGLGIMAFFMSRKKIDDENAVEAETQKEQKQHPASDSAAVAPLDPLSLELGYGLIPLVDKEHGAELLERITRIRREAALDLGLMVPRIRIIDNMRLDPNEYSFKIKGVETGRAKIRQGHYLAINPGTVRDEIEGEKTFDPAFGLPARWINESQREKAENAGYTVVDTPSIIATHLTEIIKRHASEILGRQELQSILETTKHDYPAVIEDVKKTLSNGEIQKVLQALLREQISIRNQVTILETLADYGVVTKDITYLTEKVRQALGRQICNQYSENKKLHVMTVESSLESQIIESKVETTSGSIAALEPDFYRAWIRAASNTVKGVQEAGHVPIILSSEAARPLIRSSLEREMPDVIVLSVPEIVPDVQIEALGEISTAG
jgi:flagellar biosynthesis protein FlhA